MTPPSIFLSTTIAIAFASAFVTIPAEAHGGGGGGGGGAFRSPAAAPQLSRVIANPSVSNTRPSGLGAIVSTRTGSSASIPSMAVARPIKPSDEAPSRNTGNQGQSPGSRRLGLNDIVRSGGRNSTLRAPSEESTAGAHYRPVPVTFRLNTPLPQEQTPTAGKTTGLPGSVGTSANPETSAKGSSGTAPSNGSDNGATSSGATASGTSGATASGTSGTTTSGPTTSASGATTSGATSRSKGNSKGDSKGDDTSHGPSHHGA